MFRRAFRAATAVGSVALGGAVVATAAEHPRPVPIKPLDVRDSKVFHPAPKGWYMVDMKERHKGRSIDHHFIHSSIKEEGLLERYELWVHPEMGEVRLRGRFGKRACGHATVVHGGALAAIIDDTLGATFFAFGAGFGFTATLNLSYRRPVPPGQDFVVVSKVVGNEGRKYFLEARIEEDVPSADAPWNRASADESPEPIVFVQADSLFVAKSIPKTVEELKKQNEAKRTARA